jgi:chloramphenicol-sensitive protein RarD
LIYLSNNNQATFLHLNTSTDTWLALAGIVTVVPLLLFTAGARLLPMTTTGILFYITPTMQFITGTIVFNEEINRSQIIGFIGIWIGLALYTYSLLKHGKS